MVSYHIALGCLTIIKLGKIFKPGHIYTVRSILIRHLKRKMIDRLCTFVWQINTANVTHDLLITALYILLMYDLEINRAGLDGGLLKPFQYPRVNNMFQLYTSQV